MAGRLIKGAAALSELVRPASEADAPGLHRVLPVVPELSALLPGRGLRRGSTVAVAAGRSGTVSLMLALLSAASRAGSWCAVVGLPDLGALAAEENGIALDRLALIPNPGPDWPTVAGALIDGVDVVVTAIPGPVAAPVAARLVARARQRGSVLMPFGPWPGADVTLRVTAGAWEGLGQGRGRLRRRRITVMARGRGAADRPREATMWMPGSTRAPAIPPLALPAAPPAAPSSAPSASPTAVSSVLPDPSASSASLTASAASASLTAPALSPPAASSALPAPSAFVAPSALSAGSSSVLASPATRFLPLVPLARSAPSDSLVPLSLSVSSVPLRSSSVSGGFADPEPDALGRPDNVVDLSVDDAGDCRVSGLPTFGRWAAAGGRRATWARPGGGRRPRNRSVVGRLVGDTARPGLRGHAPRSVASSVPVWWEFVPAPRSGRE